jgi:hypothetical protein|tara:strand:- start:14 stop:616 length:603 start_codon:yes stop_codon:yes gene_type:complete
MATSTSPLARQPTKLDYASPTQFRFGIHQLPKVEFFTVQATLPAISLSDVVIPTPYKSIPIMGDQLSYDNLSIGFIVDEYLENYLSIHEWMIAIGFPKSRQQFSDFKTNISNTPAAPRSSASTSSDIGDVQAPSPANALFSDATLTILSNKNNPIVNVLFRDLYPVSISALEYNQAATDVEYITATVDFAYQIYEIESIS